MTVFGFVYIAHSGYTNNEQEHIFKKYQVSSCQMMKYVNVWQVIFLGLYLTFMHFVSHESGPSELQQAYNLLLNCSEARHDVAIFCLCAAVGQLTIFVVMKEFGSLMWITISITRKLFTILVSVIMFNHVICFEQWMGVAAVFAGMILYVHFLSYIIVYDTHVYWISFSCCINCSVPIWIIFNRVDSGSCDEL